MYRFILICLLFFPLSLFAQYGKAAKRAALKTRNKQISRFTVRTDFSKSKRYVSFGGGLGAANYFGDLAPRSTRVSSDLQSTKTYITCYYLARVHPNVNIRTQLSFQQLKGDDFSVSRLNNPTPSDIGRFKRNLSFRNNIFEINSCGIFELFPTDRGYLRRNFVNPYGLIGISLFHHNPQTKTPVIKGEESDWIDLQPLGTEGQFTGVVGTPKPYSLWQIGVPLGAGVRYRLMDKWDLSLEFCYRFVFTDYLDDVSGRYPSEEVYQEMLNQGNYTGITLSNRSSETFAAMENSRRADVLKQWKDYSLPNKTNTYLTDGERTWTRLIGNESGATPRGSKKRDYGLTTGIHLSYILEIKQKPPKFR
jgi:opacity protein-like surface antigen